MQEKRLEVLSASSGDLANAALPHEEDSTGNSPLQLAKVLGRPANQPGNSPEEKELNNPHKPIPPGQIRKAYNAELLEQCNQISKCSAKLQNAKQGRRPPTVLPAGKPGESPEEKEWSTLPKPIRPAPRRQPGSDLSLPEKESTLLSLLNPFAVSEAPHKQRFPCTLLPKIAIAVSHLD